MKNIENKWKKMVYSNHRRSYQEDW